MDRSPHSNNFSGRQYPRLAEIFQLLLGNKSPRSFFAAVAAAESTEILSFEDRLVEEVSVTEEILAREAMAEGKHRVRKGISDGRQEEDEEQIAR